MKKITLVLIGSLSAAIGLGQSVQFLTPGKPEENGMSQVRLARIDQSLNNYLAQGYVPGGVALIVRNGKIIYEKSFGHSDLGNKTPVRNDNIFRIASQSKAITSLAVMMLWEEGRFLLDDQISKYIPEFKNPKVLVWFDEKDSSYSSQPAKSEITIRQLLTHTSGIDYAAIGNREMRAIYAKAGVPSGAGTTNGVLAEKIKILGHLPLRHNPGEQWTYGLNSDVLGYLVEVLSGMTFDDFLQKKIFMPLGMNDTYFYLPKEKYDRLVSLYEVKNNQLSKHTGAIFDNGDPNFPRTNGSYLSGGAGLSSTVEDYAKFLQLFLNKGEFNGVRLLGRKTVELMLTNQLQPPTSEFFGLGFGLETPENDFSSPLTVGSFYWAGAYNTQYWADPREKLIGIIFSNVYSIPLRQWPIGEQFKTLVYQAIVD